MPAPIHFYFDFSSPFAYLASTWLPELAHAHGREVQWNAILLGVTFQAADLRPPITYPLKGAYTRTDLLRSARFEGVPYVHPAVFPIPTQHAARVFWWLWETRGPEAAAAWGRAGLRAYFAEGVLLNDLPSLQALAGREGLDPDEIAAFGADPVWKDRLRRANEDAVSAGVFGAPSFVVDGELFWGNDRKPQLTRWLQEGPF